MYQALYRKWRPKTFSDMVDQRHITEILRSTVATGRQAHAYLFTGSRGTGKTSSAKILAKALNCENPQDGEPCLVCESCVGIEDGTIMDVTEIDAASNNGVDSIRQLREEAVFTPQSVKFRVYIIDETHMLSTGAFNALLKLMEEPPPHLIFILATTEAHKVPATILSRCQRFDFRRVRPESIAERLHDIAVAENATITGDAALLIGRISNGGVRDAISLLDQCLSITETVTVETVAQAAGLADRGYLGTLAAAVIGGDVAETLRIVDELYRMSVDFSRLTEELLGYFRNLMIAGNISEPGSLIVGTPDELATLRQTARSAPHGLVLRALDLLQGTLERLSRAPQPRVEFELCLIRLCRRDLDHSPDALLTRIEALEAAVRRGAMPDTAPAAPPPKTAGNRPAQTRSDSPQTPDIPPWETAETIGKGSAGVASQPKKPSIMDAAGGVPPAVAVAGESAGSETAPAQTPDTPPWDTAETTGMETAQHTTAAPTSPPVEPGQSAVGGFETAPGMTRLRCWPDVLETLSRLNPPLRGALAESCCYLPGGDLALIHSASEVAFDLIRGSENAKESLRQALERHTGIRYRLGPYRPEPEETPALPAPDLLKGLLKRARDLDIPISEA